ncbi:MAG: zinc-ribbon domain-containing protein [Candidatus Obscuribacter sp.]|nr:zinc-ribbon domain-containing protein [Candidatus Obscuribacter sp.]
MRKSKPTIRPGQQSLAHSRPDVARQWHPDLNGDLTPKDFSAGSTFRAWWKCPRADDHVFQKAICTRTIAKSKWLACPFCAGREDSKIKRLPISGRKHKKPLTVTHPHIARQWDKRKNAPWKPEDFTAGSGFEAHWICTCGHRFKAKIAQRALTRASSQGCPGCRIEVLRENRTTKPSISQTHPELSKQWDYAKNAGTPHDYSRGSNEDVFWICPFGQDHRFKARICARTRSHTKSMSCPFCYGRRPSVTNSLASLNPELLKEYSPKNKKKPSLVIAGSGTKVIWCCKDCRFEWKAAPAVRTKTGYGCPRCNHGESIDLTKYKRLMKMLDGNKNEHLDLKKIKRDDRIYWKCPKAKDHLFVSGFGQGDVDNKCPFCRNRKASSANNLLHSYPKLARELHPEKNGNLKAKDIVPTSTKRVWWRCAKDKKHEWQAIVWTRTTNAYRCPYCAGKRATEETCLLATHPAIAKEFDKKKNAPLTPKDLLPGSHKSVWWKCQSGHQYEMVVARRTRRKTICPICAAK